MPRPGPHLALRTEELREMGVGRSRLRARDIVRPYRGAILLPGANLEEQTVRDQCLSYAPLLTPRCFFTRRTAAALWGFPAPKAPQGQLEIGALRPGRVPNRPGIMGHQCAEDVLQLEERYGLPVPSAADVWCLLAAVIPIRELVAVGDYLISGPVAKRRRPVATPEELAAAVQRHARTPGAVQRRRALAMLRSPVDSRPETLMRLAAIEAGLPEPVVACPVRTQGKNGSLELHADNGYPQWQIASEYEGQYHFTDPRQAKIDAERWELMTDAGWRVIRVSSLDFPDFREYIARLKRTIAQRSR